MNLHLLPQALSVCKRSNADGIDLARPFYFLSRTDEELSLVCPTDEAPRGAIAREDGWRAFRIEGVLDFSLIGILARLTGILAENGVGLFAVSTFNTDYILVKAEALPCAVKVLTAAGYTFDSAA